MSKFKVGDIVSPNEKGAGLITGYHRHAKFTVTQVGESGKTFRVKEDNMAHSAMYWELASKKEKRWIVGNKVFYTEKEAKEFVIDMSYHTVLEVEIVAEHTPTTISTTTWTKKEL